MDKAAFDFSVIIPVFNVEDYIEETVDSVISQSLGFDRIQLILVNDGSTDGSADICKRYKEEYPDNIVYIEEENGGVSSARNAGLKEVRGRYVNFLDADDKWDRDAFRSASEFFASNPDVRIATGRFVFFGAKEGRHHLDYKYEKTGTADLEDRFDYPEMSVAKTFFAADILDGMSFNEDLEISEDMLFINELLLREMKYGVIREAVYFYRKREEHTSAIDRSTENISWYTATVTGVFEELIRRSEEIHGKVIPYIQYLLITDLQWRLNRAIPDSLPADVADSYYESIMRILSKIDDDIIIGHRTISSKYKRFILKLRHQDNEYEPDQESSKALMSKTGLRINILKVTDCLLIEGEAAERYIDDSCVMIAADQDGKEYPFKYRPYPVLDVTGIDPSIKVDGYSHRVELPLKAGAQYRFIIRDKYDNSSAAKLSYGKFSRLTNARKSYFTTDDFIVKKDRNSIRVFRYSRLLDAAFRYRYEKHLREIADERIVRMRRESRKLLRKSRKPIWIVSDRTNQAGDNGEALFDYLMNSEYKNKYDIYFLIDSDSEDYERMCKKSRVLIPGSDEHLITQLAASAVVSSAGDEWVFNPFADKHIYVRDLIDYDFVFLQHGVIKDDLSEWLHKYRKNIRLFVTSAYGEYESICEGNYGYGKDEVILTGLARFDKLFDSAEKIISIMPTWRMYLIGASEEGTSTRGYSEDFKNSDYCRFYNRLINDKDLIRAMEDNGYKGVFYLHPSHREQEPDFEGNDTIRVWNGRVDYTKIIGESSLLVTDYSSLAMDYAYLKKPVIYTQTDREEFYKGQIYSEGYFDYEENGFGPVCLTYEDTVAEMIRAIENGCREPEKYSNRVETFFAHTDRNNCERIANEIAALT